MGKVYRVMDAAEEKTLEVAQDGRWADGSKDFYCCVYDGGLLAEAELEGIDDPYTVTEWAAEHGFEFAEGAERFAAHVIDDALIREICGVDEAASRELAAAGGLR